MPPEAIAAATIITLVAGTLAIIEVLWKPIRRFALRREDPPGATRQQVEQVQNALDELKEKLASSQPDGAPEIGTKELAKAAGPDTETRLQEALELQSQNKEVEAIDALYEAFRRDLEPVAKAELHLLLAESYLHLGDLNQARSHHSQGLEVARLFNLRETEATFLLAMAIVDAQIGRDSEAEGHFQDSIRIYNQLGKRALAAGALGNLGLFHMFQGKLDLAEWELQESLAASRELGFEMFEARSLGSLGLVAFRRGDEERAISLHREALVINRRLNLRRAEAQALANIGIAFLAGRNFNEAESFLNDSLIISQEIEDRLTEGRQIANLGFLAERRQERSQACSYYKEALAILNASGVVPEAGQVRASLKRLGCDDDA